MSLLREIKKNVVEGVEVNIGQVWDSVIKNNPNLGLYTVVNGYVEPRAESNLLLLDNVTNEPLQVPPDCFPVRTFFVPEVLLESPDLSNSYLE